MDSIAGVGAGVVPPALIHVSVTGARSISFATQHGHSGQPGMSPGKKQIWRSCVRKRVCAARVLRVNAANKTKKDNSSEWLGESFTDLELSHKAVLNTRTEDKTDRNTVHYILVEKRKERKERASHQNFRFCSRHYRCSTFDSCSTWYWASPGCTLSC